MPTVNRGIVTPFVGRDTWGQNSGYEFFGLKTTPIIDYIKVTWPSGAIDIFGDIGVNQSMTIVEGSGVLDEVPETMPPSAEEGNDLTNDEEEVLSELDNPVNDDQNDESQCPDNEMVLFPNPSDDGYYGVCTEFDESNLQVDVFDLTGQNVATKWISAKEPGFDLSNLKSGVYVVRVTHNDKIVLKKILKK